MNPIRTPHRLMGKPITEPRVIMERKPLVMPKRTEKTQSRQAHEQAMREGLR